VRERDIVAFRSAKVALEEASNIESETSEPMESQFGPAEAFAERNRLTLKGSNNTAQGRDQRERTLGKQERGITQPCKG
jgi:hypothetical protein